MDEQKINEGKQQLIEWLSDPRELGGEPAKIEYVRTFTDQDDIECMIFRFKKTLFSKWMLGIASEAGAFSEMQVYNEETAEENAAECLEWIKNYWKRMAAEQAGEVSNEYEERKGRFIAFILLSDRTWGKEQLLEDLDKDWGIKPENEEEEEKDESNDDTAVFQVGAAMVVLGFMNMPIPNQEAEQNAAMNYTWKEAVEVTKTHQAHIIVSIMGDHKDPIQDGELFVKVIASLCKQKNVIGVNTNGVVYQPQYYFAMKEMMARDMFPLLGLVWFGVLRTEKGFHVYTIGMNNFGKDEMEILDADEDLNELKDFMMGIAGYCIESDVILRDGESVGLTADQRCQITRSEGVCIDGMTLKISYRKE